MPSDLTGVTWTCVADGGANCDDVSGSDDISTTVDLPPGDSVTFTVSATVDPAATGTLTNVATVAAPSGVTDTDLTDNSATDEYPLVPVADLSITKDDGGHLVDPRGRHLLRDRRDQRRPLLCDRRTGHRHDATGADRRHLGLPGRDRLQRVPTRPARVTSPRPSTSRRVAPSPSPSMQPSRRPRAAHSPTPPWSTCRPV